LCFSEAVTFNIQFRRVQGINRNNIRQILDNILRQQLANLHTEDRVGVEINHPSLDKRVLVPFTEAGTLSAEKILSVIERIQQSNPEFQFDEDIRLKLVIVNNSRGGKHAWEATTTRIVNWDTWFAKHCGHGG